MESRRVTDGALRQKHHERLTGRDIGEEYLFYDPDTDRVYILNATAREIYLLCNGLRDLDEIAHTIARRYEIDAETADRDCSEAVEQLVELGLVERDGY
jgi:hypothetical protein